jgi:hypothetical protein
MFYIYGVRLAGKSKADGSKKSRFDRETIEFRHMQIALYVRSASGKIEGTSQHVI